MFLKPFETWLYVSEHCSRTTYSVSSDLKRQNKNLTYVYLTGEVCVAMNPTPKTKYEYFTYRQCFVFFRIAIYFQLQVLHLRKQTAVHQI